MNAKKRDRDDGVMERQLKNEKKQNQMIMIIIIIQL